MQHPKWHEMIPHSLRHHVIQIPGPISGLVESIVHFEFCEVARTKHRGSDLLFDPYKHQRCRNRHQTPERVGTGALKYSTVSKWRLRSQDGSDDFSDLARSERPYRSDLAAPIQSLLQQFPLI
jgi:hypothetical protein